MMKTLVPWTHAVVAGLFAAASSATLLLAADTKPTDADSRQPTVIPLEEVKNWDVRVFAGNPGLRDFMPGRAAESAISGMLAFDSKGNGYVAAGTFVGAITRDGWCDVLTGHPGLAGATDGPPGRATFGEVLDIALVNDDLLYVVDAANFTLRRIQRTNGVWNTETVAGVPGRRGHRDGPGKDALFESVLDSVVADRDGTVYVFSGDHIRKFADGVVSTLNPKGGTGYRNGPLEEARFYHSQGRCRLLALDGKGNLYVADKVNACIRKIALKAGEVTTIAGRLPEHPRQAPRDGKGTDARFHPGGGPVTLLYDTRRDRMFLAVDDEQVLRAVIKEPDGWHARTASGRWRDPSKIPISGLPAGTDAEGNLYFARGSYIIVARAVPATNAHSETKESQR